MFVGGRGEGESETREKKKMKALQKRGKIGERGRSEGCTRDNNKKIKEN